MHHEVVAPPGGGHDDILHNWNTQWSSQWDGFRHVAHPEHGHYGGVPYQDHGMHHWAERGIIGRGVLADVERWRAAEGRSIEQGRRDAIPVAEIAKLSRGPGHRDRGGRCPARADGMTHLVPEPRSRDAARIAGAEPGAMRSPGVAPGVESVAQLWDWHIAGLGADNPGVETVVRGITYEQSLHCNLAAAARFPSRGAVRPRSAGRGLCSKRYMGLPLRVGADQRPCRGRHASQRRRHLLTASLRTHPSAVPTKGA
jgi:hypothetical protein